ncbi:MAG: hypothetical protein KBC72_01970 [Acinetobacter sp.]|nr:hypothetical protein [Acinetobacter sp.]
MKPNEVNQTDISDIEQIGTALYGEVWIAQLTRQLKNKHGGALPQSSLKSMRDRNNLPEYIRDQLTEIFDRRINELEKAKIKFHAEPKVRCKLLELRLFGNIETTIVEQIKFVDDKEVYSLIEEFTKNVQREGLIDISNAASTALNNGHYEDKHFFFRIHQIKY